MTLEFVRQSPSPQSFWNLGMTPARTSIACRPALGRNREDQRALLHLKSKIFCLRMNDAKSYTGGRHQISGKAFSFGCGGMKASFD